MHLLAGPLQPLALAPLFGHQPIEAGGVDHQAPAADGVLGEIEGKAVGVVQLEGYVPRQHAAVAEAGRRLLEQGHAAAEGGAEAHLFLAQGVDDHRFGPAQFRIGAAHLGHQRGHEPVHQRLLGPQQVGVAHRPAHDPADHIAAALVGRTDAVGDQEAGRAQMVDDHLVRELRLAGRLDPGQGFAGLDQGSEEVDVVVGMDALQHGGDPLQAHASVYLWPGQVAARAVGHLLPLHEDVVPDLHEPVAVLVRAAGRAAGDVVAVVVEDLGIGAAGTRVAHRPEVFLQAHDPIVAEAGDLLPEDRGVLVLRMDADHQPVARQGQILRDEPPGQFDRAFLEVVAKGEIAEHLEEGLVATGVTDVVQVVVLATGADALLRRRHPGCRRGLGAGEDVLERHHAGVDEQQGRSAGRAATTARPGDRCRRNSSGTDCGRR